MTTSVTTLASGLVAAQEAIASDWTTAQARLGLGPWGSFMALAPPAGLTWAGPFVPTGGGCR